MAFGQPRQEELAALLNSDDFEFLPIDLRPPAVKN
jgi:hypothetical protein